MILLVYRYPTKGGIHARTHSARGLVLAHQRLSLEVVIFCSSSKQPVVFMNKFHFHEEVCAQTHSFWDETFLGMSINDAIKHFIG